MPEHYGQLCSADELTVKILQLPGLRCAMAVDREIESFVRLILIEEKFQSSKDVVFGSLQNLNSAKDSYLMEIHLIDCSGKPSDQSKNAEVNGNGADEQAVWATWNVLFEAWNDGREHVFPHRVMRVWKP